jgi:hypothetical protein
LDTVWVSLVSYTVGTPLLAKQTVTVRDSVRGNGNGRVDPGEESDLMISLQNTGLGHGYNCSAKLRSGDARFVIEDSTSNYGYIAKGATGSNSGDLFVVYAGSSIPMETAIPCTLYAYADGGYVSPPQPFTIVVGELRTVDPIPDGPRAPALYYAYDDVDAGYPARPTYNWVEINSVGTRISYSQNDAVVMVSLPTAFGPLKFYGQRYSQVSISADAWICPGNYTTSNFTNTPLPNSGTPPGMICLNWDDLYPVSGGGHGYVYYYHDVTNHRFIIEYDSVAYYDQQSVYDKFEGIIYDTTVVTPSGDNSIFAQYMTANGYSSSTLGIEDPSRAIAIQCLYDASYNRGCAPIAAGRAIAYLTVQPTGIAEEYSRNDILADARFLVYSSPFRGTGSIAWSVKIEGAVSLKVYDLSGKVVQDLVEARLKPGRYSATWDGMDAAGRTVASGVYFYRLETALGAIARKAVKLD